jgi:hypothetical protein
MIIYNENKVSEEVLKSFFPISFFCKVPSLLLYQKVAKMI